MDRPGGNGAWRREPDLPGWDTGAVLDYVDRLGRKESFGVLRFEGVASVTFHDETLEVTARNAWASPLVFAATPVEAMESAKR